MKQQKLKEEARAELTELRKEYDIPSIYFQGSILTDDFDPETSDIDSVAFVGDDRPLEHENEMRDRLSEQVGIRLLYFSELNGEDVQGRLATFIHPELLLYAMPEWEYVAGEELNAEMFEQTPVTHEQAIQRRLEKINESRPGLGGADWRQPMTFPEDRFTYYIKNLARIIHARQSLRRGSRRPFSYSRLPDEATPEEKPIVEGILDVRSTRSLSTFQDHAERFRKFVDSLMEGRKYQPEVEQERTLNKNQ